MIKVYLDTNMLEDYAEKNLIISDKILSDKFYNFLNQVASNSSLHSAMTIIIPQVVIDEISQHIKESFQYVNELKDKAEKVFKFRDGNIIFNISKTTEQVIIDFQNEIQELVTKYPFLAIEKHKNTIDNIYYRALHKNSPFYMKNKGLDSGFKDSILWKTAIENKGTAKPIICTSDNDFDGCGIEVIKSFSDVITYANENYSSQKDLIISFISQDYIKQRMADELGYHDVKEIKVELVNFLEIDDPDMYDTEVIQVKLNLDESIEIAEFNVIMSVNEIELSQIIKRG